MPRERVDAAAVPSLALVRAAVAGDTAATARLLKAVAPRVVRVARAVLGAAHPDVDDVVQQSLIRLIGALPGFRGDCDIAAYASTIAVRTALLARRRAHVTRARHDPDGEPDQLIAEAVAPDDHLEAQTRMRLLRELLAELPEEQAEALALRIVLGLSLEEIARSAGAPQNTIRSRLRLAKEGLRKRIEQNPSLAATLAEVVS
jgi:RNA polymerase sigma-70 factor (ECF subfamily)